MTETKDVVARSQALRVQCSTLTARFTEMVLTSANARRRAENRMTTTESKQTITDVVGNPFYHRLESLIQNQQQNLASDEELQISYAGPADEIIIVLSIGYQGRDLILLYGEDEECQPTTIILEANTVALVMKNVKIPYQFERREIGFRGDIEKQSSKSDPWKLGPPPVLSK